MAFTGFPIWSDYPVPFSKENRIIPATGFHSLRYGFYFFSLINGADGFTSMYSTARFLAFTSPTMF